jgi:uncharacterized protein
MTNQTRLKKLNTTLEKLYLMHSKKLLFHGWHHVNFVRNKALQFARPIKADLFLVETAALTHDLNYIVKVFSRPSAGEKIRKKLLIQCGYSDQEIKKIENIILECETITRSQKISKEGMAVSDADTLFKALPITPIVFAGKYLTESKVDVEFLAKKIVRDQRKLFDQGIYFYTKLAKTKYLKWARQQIELWESVNDALKDKDVREILQIAEKLSVL